MLLSNFSMLSSPPGFYFMNRAAGYVSSTRPWRWACTEIICQFYAVRGKRFWRRNIMKSEFSGIERRLEKLNVCLKKLEPFEEKKRKSCFRTLIFRIFYWKEPWSCSPGCHWYRQLDHFNRGAGKTDRLLYGHYTIGRGEYPAAWIYRKPGTNCRVQKYFGSWLHGYKLGWSLQKSASIGWFRKVHKTRKSLAILSKIK